jgi:hypothetical protein
MDLPSNIKTVEKPKNDWYLDAYQKFVMRMFFTRYPKEEIWDQLMWRLANKPEKDSFTRWPAYEFVPLANLMGEMESMLADLRQDFIARGPAPKPIRPLESDPVAQENARIISQQIDKDLWEIFADTTKPLPTQKPRFNLKKSN